MTEQPTRHDLVVLAEEMATDGDWVGALRNWVDLLESDPSDLLAWHQMGLVLLELGDKELGKQALSASGRAHAERGNLPMALAAAKLLAPHDGGGAKTLTDHVVGLYAQGSERLTDGKLAPPRLEGPPPAELMPKKTPRAELVRAGAAAHEVSAKAADEFAGRRPSVRSWPLFSKLNSENFRDFVGLMELKAFAAGDKLIEQGDAAKSFFVIARGTARVYRGETEVGVVRSGTFVGEMAILARSKRQASAVCDSQLQAFEVDADKIAKLAEREADFGEQLAQYCRTRLLDNLAKTSPVLKPLPEQERSELLRRFEPAFYSRGDLIVQEAVEGDALYLLVTGEVEVLKQEGEDSLRVAQLVTGDVFGEISLITRRPTTASVRAVSRVVTLRLARETFDEVAAQYPQMLADLYKLGSEREREADALIRSSEIEIGDDALV